MKRPPLARLVCAFSLLWLLAPPLSGQLRDEREVKAAFVFNLTRYVEWPQAPSELFVGFVGDGPMGEVLEKMLAGKSSESRPMHVLILPSDEQLERCQVLYISDSSPRKVQAALDRVRNKNILTVGDADSFARNGGMVGLVRADERIQIQVNLQATKDAGLKISSRLLGLATIVGPAPGAKD